MDKRSLILFSGGLDSTFALHRHMCDAKPFDLLYVDAGQSANKIKAEKLASKQILEVLKQRYEGTARTDALGFKYVRTHSSVRMADSPKVSFSQIVPWLIGALEAVDPAIHDEVILSYVCGDQINPLVNEILAAWENLWKISKIGELVPLVFPYIYVPKLTIMNELPTALRINTWVCEVPVAWGDEVVPCGRCLACIRRKTLYYEYELHNREVAALDVWTLRSLEIDEIIKNTPPPVEEVKEL